MKSTASDTAPGRRSFGTGPRTADAVRSLRSDRWLVLLPLFTTLFLAKWVMPGGPRDFAMAWPLIFGALLLGVITGRMRFDTPRLLFFLLLIGTLGAVQVMRADGFSPTSMLLMASIYLAYTVTVTGARDYDTAVVLSRFAVIVAVLGIAQFALQFALPRALVFPIENLLPKALVIQGYNAQIPISYGSSIYKANGVFPLEPSFFSQFLAVAVIAELCGRNRWPRLVLFGAGLLVSYSGTGIIILMIALPIVIIAYRRWEFLVAGLLALMLMLMFSGPLNLDLYLQRAGEFSSVRSSGFERFVGALYLFEQFLWDDPLRALLGYGSGQFQDFSLRANLPVSEMALSKIVFEFGLLGALAIFAFLGYCLSRSSAPLAFKVAVAVMFFMSGIYTSTSHGIALTVLVWSGAWAAASVTGASRERKADAKRSGGARKSAAASRKRRDARPAAQTPTANTPAADSPTAAAASLAARMRA